MEGSSKVPGAAGTTVDSALCRALLLERARSAGDGEQIDEDAAIEALLERDIHVPDPTEPECRRYYERYRSRFVADVLVEASHILFAVVPATPIESIRAQAVGALRKLCAEPDRFESMAASFSNCPSAQVGGSLGQLAPGDVVPELRSALFQTKAMGIVPELVRSRHGLHILRIQGRHPGRQVPFEQVRARIAVELSGRSWEAAARQYVERLREGRARS